MENYQISRKVVKSVFIPLYHPRIINKEIIPKDEPVIFCGNHLHVWDQVPVICSTNKTIHWMAKQEYFDSKMAWLYKMFECIPVDRYNNPHQSMETAIKYLKNGDSIGLFPEGTRNKLYFARQQYINILNKYENNLKNKHTASYYEELKQAKEKLKMVKKDLENRHIYDYDEHDILLPFKNGAIRMSKETNTLIVPFGVTGDYKICNNNLILSYGEPIDTKNYSINEANKILRDSIKKLVLENRNR